MNSLSWFLYLADVLPNIFVLPIVFLGIATLIGGIISIVATCSISSDISTYPNNKSVDIWKAQLETAKLWLKRCVIALCFWLLLVVLNGLIPSRETFYMIAGSEIGEQVVKTPEAREIFDDIKKVIKQQIKTPKVSTDE